MIVRGPFPDQPVRPGVPWNLEHLKVGLVATLALAVVGVPIGWWAQGGRGALGVVVGLAIVAAFFCFGSWAVAFAGRYDDRLTLPAAMASYSIKIGLLGIVVVTLPDNGPIDRPSMAFTVLVGTLVWSAVQIRYVWTKRQVYVDYTPPTGSRDDA